MPASAPAVTKFFPLSEVKRGMKGVAYTVFEGVNPEPMQVEILGLLKDALGPGQDMILARLHGDKPEYTGVVAGMSGSPVYIDGRLVGAISYRIGQFSKEPIAGITPIESMLQVRDGDGDSSGMQTAEVTKSGAGIAKDGQSPEIRSDGDAADVWRIQPGGCGSVWGQVSGVRADASGWVGRRGLRGSAAGAAGAGECSECGAGAGGPVDGGDVHGDVCRPEEIIGLRASDYAVWAVDMPMTKATVLASLASPLNAFKIINTTETVGAFTEDRASAIMGRFGVQARMIPVVVEVVPPSGADKAVVTPKKTSLRGAGQPAVDAFGDAGVGVPEPADEQYGWGGDELPADGRDWREGAAAGPHRGNDGAE